MKRALPLALGVGIPAVALAVVLAVTLNRDPAPVPAPAPPATVVHASQPTERDMIHACQDSLTLRLHRSQHLEAHWTTADATTSPDFTQVTGTGVGTAVDGAIRVPFTYTCTVQAGPPVVVVDNGFKLNP